MQYRIYAFILLGMLSVTHVFGQFSIDSAENYRKGNQRHYAIGFTDSLESLIGSADTNWDFNDVAFKDSVKQEILDPDSTEEGSDFPDATLVESYSNGNRVFHNRQSDGNLYVGLKSSQDILFNFIRPFKVIKRPFAYKQTHRDTGRREYTFNDFPVQGTGEIFSEAIGWGTIELPDTTYDSTLLVYNQQNWQDTAETPFGDAIITNETISYVWFAKDRSYPLVRLDSVKISSDFTNDTSSTLQYYYPTKDTSSDEPSDKQGGGLRPGKPDIKAYHAGNRIWLEGELSKSRSFTIRLKNLKGQTILTREKTVSQGAKTSIAVDEIKSGVYILQLKSSESDQRVINQKIVIP